MRIPLASILLILGALGLSAGPAGAVEPSGPFCLSANFQGGRVLAFFILPMGTLPPPPSTTQGRPTSFSLTGTNIEASVPLSGTGILVSSGSQFQFVLSGSHLVNFPDALEVWSGFVDDTGTGAGRHFVIPGGTGTPVTYTVQA